MKTCWFWDPPIHSPFCGNVLLVSSWEDILWMEALLSAPAVDHGPKPNHYIPCLGQKEEDPMRSLLGLLTKGQDGCWKAEQDCRLELTPQEPENEEPVESQRHILWMLKLS